MQKFVYFFFFLNLGLSSCGNNKSAKNNFSAQMESDATKSGSTTTSATSSVSFSENVVINASLDDSATLTSSGVGTIVGTLKLSDQKDPSNILVAIPGTSFESVTDASGNYILSGVPAGTQGLIFEKDGYLNGLYEGVSVATNQTVNLDPIILLFATGSTDGFFVTNAISGKSGSQKITLTLNPPADSISYMISESSDFTNGVWTPLKTNIAYTFASDGTKTLNIKFKDSNAKESTPFSETLIVDSTAPTGTLVIQDGSGAIASNHTTLTISSTSISPITGIKIDTDSDMTNATWIPYASSIPWTFEGGDGEKNIHIVLINEWGKESAIISGNVFLDTSNPLNPSISIPASTGGQPGFSNSTQITLTLSATLSQPNVTISQVILSESSNFTGASYVPFRPTMPFQLSSREGSKVVYAKLKDSLGHVSATVSAITTLDLTPPTGIVIANQSRRMNSTSETVTLLSGANDKNFFSFQVQGAQYSDWTNVKPPIVFNLTTMNSWNTLQLRAIDTAGNTGPVTSYTVYYGDKTILEPKNPGFTSTLVNSGALKLTTAFNPYLVATDTVVDASIATNFTLDPGVVLQFADAVNFSVNYGAANHFAVNGTKAQHVIFTSASLNPLPGSWGIFTIASPATISYLDAQYNSYFELNNLAAGNGITIQDSTFKNFNTYGLHLTDGAGIFALSYSTIDCGSNGFGIYALSTAAVPMLTGALNNVVIENCPIAGINWPQVAISQSNFLNNGFNFIAFNSAIPSQNLNNNYWGNSNTNASFNDLKNFSPGVDTIVNTDTKVSSYILYSTSPISNAGPR